MIFASNLVKIKLVDEGYFKNYPYHLISDEEMCDAFLHYEITDDPDSDWESFKSSDELSYFKDKYPLLDESLETKYRELVENIAYHINKFKSSNDDVATLPDWIWSYMLDCVLSVDSDKRDIHDMLVPLGIDNLDDDFLPEACEACYKVSSEWLSKIPESEKDHRPPTLFGEPHVLKCIRLYQLATE